MERFAWHAVLCEGKKEEYIKRHDEIWPEMTKVLNEAGVHNYTIWNTGEHLFGYYECENLEYALKVQRESEVVRQWDKSMEGIMVMEKDESGSSMMMKVFLHE